MTSHLNATNKASSITMGELARKLNLSSSTVSRALTRPDMVAPKTRQKVLEAVKASGYRPNQVARSLRTRHMHAIGLVVSDITNPFYAELVRAVEGVAVQHDYNVIICNADENAEKEEQALWLLADTQVKGIIHASTGATLETLQALRARGIAIIDVDRVSGLEDTDTVLVDSFLGAKLATEHLLDLGHRRVATIAGPSHLTTGRERLEGFRLVLEEARILLPDAYLEQGDFREASAHHATLRLLSLAEPPTALFVANNEMLTGSLAALRKHRVAIPNKLSIVSFDDVPWAEYIEPPLTVVAQPTGEIGKGAAELLFRRLGGQEQAVKKVLAPHLIVRGSTAPPSH